MSNGVRDFQNATFCLTKFLSKEFIGVEAACENKGKNFFFYFPYAKKIP
jgi:hypothetical protein